MNSEKQKSHNTNSNDTIPNLISGFMAVGGVVIGGVTLIATSPIWGSYLVIKKIVED